MNLELRDGLFCNCNGEGTDVFVMMDQKTHVSTATLPEDLDLNNPNAVKEFWNNSIFWIEAYRKIHFKFVPKHLLGKTIFDF